jgi:hypothetical protein
MQQFHFLDRSELARRLLLVLAQQRKGEVVISSRSPSLHRATLAS